jgi:hypothetical protein
MKKFPWKQIFVILVLGGGVFVLWEIYKAWRAGVSDIKSLILAPWTAAKKVWASLAAGVSSLVAPSPTSSPAALTASLGIDPNSALGQMFQQDAQNALSQVAAGDTGLLSTPSNGNDQVVGIWGTPTP